MTLEKHLGSVSKDASRRLGILRKSSRVFHDRLLLGRCFRSCVQLGLECCFVVWCSAAMTPLNLLNRVFSGARFLTVVVLECDIEHSIMKCCIRSGAPDEPSLLCSTCAVCPSAGYTQCFALASVYLCASSLK